MFKLEIKTGGAAFRDENDNLDPWNAELFRILDDVKDKLNNGKTEGNIMDINGNKVGSWRLED